MRTVSSWRQVGHIDAVQGKRTHEASVFLIPINSLSKTVSLYVTDKDDK